MFFFNLVFYISPFLVVYYFFIGCTIIGSPNTYLPITHLRLSDSHLTVSKSIYCPLAYTINMKYNTHQYHCLYSTTFSNGDIYLVNIEIDFFFPIILLMILCFNLQHDNLNLLLSYQLLVPLSVDIWEHNYLMSIRQIIS